MLLTAKNENKVYFLNTNRTEWNGKASPVVSLKRSSRRRSYFYLQLKIFSTVQYIVIYMLSDLWFWVNYKCRNLLNPFLTSMLLLSAVAGQSRTCRSLYCRVSGISRGIVSKIVFICKTDVRRIIFVASRLSLCNRTYIKLPLCVYIHVLSILV